MWQPKNDSLTIELHHDNAPRYYIDLERCKTCAEILDWIIQVSKKTWCTPDILSDLVLKLDYLLDIQANFCSSGFDKGLVEIPRILKETKAWREKIANTPIQMMN